MGEFKSFWEGDRHIVTWTLPTIRRTYIGAVGQAIADGQPYVAAMLAYNHRRF